MGKLKLELLKGIEEQEKAIDTSMANDKSSDVEPLKETLKEQQQADGKKNNQPLRKNSKADKTGNMKKSGQKASELSDKRPDKTAGGVSEEQPAGTGESANEMIADSPQEKNVKKKFINFDITDIDRYLTAVAGIYGKSKTKYLHDLVVADMKVHPEIEALIRR